MINHILYSYSHNPQIWVSSESCLSREISSLYGYYIGGGGGGGEKNWKIRKIGKFMKQKKKPKSTLFVDNTQGLITTNKAQASRFCSTASHHSVKLENLCNKKAHIKLLTYSHNIQQNNHITILSFSLIWYNGGVYGN